MAFMLKCPACQKEGLDPRRQATRCTACGAAYTLKPFCSQCDDELERVQACGAVDFFCNRCNNLVSKRSARFEITPAE